MAVSSTKTELLDAVRTTFRRLRQDLDRVPVDEARHRDMPGHAAGTSISPADLVAYLVGWNRQVLLWHGRREEGLPDEFPASGFSWNQLGDLAQHYYAEHASDPWDDLRAQLDDAHRSILELIELHSDEELYGAAWYRTWTMGRMISLNTASPYTNARTRIRTWLRARTE